MSKKSDTKIIEVPKRVVDSMMEVYEKWENFSEEFEDFIFASDFKFIKKMKKARKEDVLGNLESLDDLKKEF